MTRSRLVGLMSGTSMDAIDAVLVEFDDATPRLVHGHSHPWPTTLVERIRDLARAEYVSLDELGQLDALAGDSFAEAAQARDLHELGGSAPRSSRAAKEPTPGVVIPQGVVPHVCDDDGAVPEAHDPRHLVQEVGILAFALADLEDRIGRQRPAVAFPPLGMLGLHNPDGRAEFMFCRHTSGLSRQRYSLPAEMRVKSTFVEVQSLKT